MEITLHAYERFGKIDHIVFLHPQYVKGQSACRLGTDPRETAEGIY